MHTERGEVATVENLDVEACPTELFAQLGEASGAISFGKCQRRSLANAERAAGAVTR